MPFSWHDEMLLREAAASPERAVCPRCGRECAGHAGPGLFKKCRDCGNRFRTAGEPATRTPTDVEQLRGAVRRERRAFVVAAIVAGVMWVAAIAGWLTVWWRN